MIQTDYCIIQTTVGSDAEARMLAQQLVHEKLAACVQIHPISSVYVWQGETQDEAEFLLLIKTKADLYSQLEKLLLEHHPYETPEIIRVPIEGGSEEYLGWMNQVLSRTR